MSDFEYMREQGICDISGVMNGARPRSFFSSDKDYKRYLSEYIADMREMYGADL